MAIRDRQPRRERTSRRLARIVATRIVAIAVIVGGCARDDAEWRADLEHPDVFARGIAAIALCEESPDVAEAAVPALLEAFEGPRLLLREPARRALLRIGTAAADDLLTRLRMETELARPTRRALIDALAQAGPSAIPKILAAMWDPGVSNAREIGLILARIGGPAVVPVLEALHVETADKRRLPLVWVLGQIGPAASAALPDLLDALGQGSSRQAAFVLESLQRIQPTGEGILPALQTGLAHEDAIVREAAACGIARTHVARAARLSKDAWPGEMAATLALGELAWSAVVEGAKDEDATRASFARACLFALGARIELAPKRRDLLPLRADAGTPAAPVRGHAFPDLVNDRPGIRGAAALRCASRGRSALPALTTLLDMTRDAHPGVAVASQWAVWCIVLDACAPWLQPAAPRAR